MVFNILMPPLLVSLLTLEEVLVRPPLLFMLLLFLSFLLLFNLFLNCCRFILYLANIFIFKILIESVFNLADCSSKERLHLANLRPLGANLLVHLKDKLVFLGCPISSDDVWVYHVVPALTTLPTEAAW